MLMSVAERGREIGILRAVGASRLDVFRLILLESVQFCFVGGVAGVVLAIVCSRGIEAWLRSRLPFAPTDSLINWEWWLVAACIGGAIALGALAGLLPASRAAEMAPMKAIREGARV